MSASPDPAGLRGPGPRAQAPGPRTERSVGGKGTLVVLFDGGCPLCRRTVRQLRAIDWRHRLQFVDGTNAETRERFAPGLTEAALLIQMYVIDERGGRYAGYEGSLKIAGVVPLLWPFWLVGRLPGIRALGHIVYRTIAANRMRRGRCTDDLCEAPIPDRRV